MTGGGPSVAQHEGTKASCRIVRLAAGGDGVGKLADGRTVFVPRSAPGDLVELTGIREYRRFARARIGRLVEASADRVEPRCPHFVHDECGGCQVQHLRAEAQLEMRRTIVGDAFRRIAKIPVDDPPIEPAGQSYDYRTKITLAVAAGGRRIGLHPLDRPRDVFALEWCHITAPPLMELWQVLRRFVPLLPPRLTHVVLRLDRSGARHIVFRTEGEGAWGGGVALAAELARAEMPATIWWHPEGGAARAVGGATEAFPATVFEQVNPVMGDRVRVHAVAQLGPVAGRRVWDLYAGIGETTTRLVELGAAVESVEIDPRAVAEAEARGPAARRHVGAVEELLNELRDPDLVVTNPPRTGMDGRAVDALAARRPERIVYISCDPATLARDVARLQYRVAAVRAFDLFPQTAHVETVTLLERP